jgi:plasmid stabilization system protein ParE
LRYTVVVQPSAEAEIEAAYVYLAQAASPDVAIRWFNELDAAIDTLVTMPRRCPLAPEDAYFADEIRQLLVAPYRVLFTIRQKRVHVLHVRHRARRTLGPSGSGELG